MRKTFQTVCVSQPVTFMDSQLKWFWKGYVNIVQLKRQDSNHRYAVTHEQPTSIIHLTCGFRCPAERFRTTKWLDWESNQVKNNPEEKNVVVVLADFQVLLVAAETGIDRNKSRLCYFQMHCSWLREECDEPCLWLDQVPLLVAALLEPGWDRAPRVEGRAWGWKGLWVWSCSGVRPRPSR